MDCAIFLSHQELFCIMRISSSTIFLHSGGILHGRILCRILHCQPTFMTISFIVYDLTNWGFLPICKFITQIYCCIFSFLSVCILSQDVILSISLSIFNSTSSCSHVFIVWDRKTIWMISIVYTVVHHRAYAHFITFINMIEFAYISKFRSIHGRYKKCIWTIDELGTILVQRQDRILGFSF